jgi:hypothetical protein
LRAEALLLLLFLVWFASPCEAVYLFLDSDGDGVRTSTDVVSPEGATKVALWLLTDRYPEGKSDDCSHGRREGDHHYSMVLRASQGRLSWRPSVINSGLRAKDITYETDDSTYVVIRGRIPDRGTEKRYQLGAITVEVLRGRPSIEFAYGLYDNPPPDYATRLSTGAWDGPVSVCGDGLPYGGTPNRAPRFTRLGDYIIKAGTSERLVIQVGDDNGDPLTFRLIRGPSFVSVSTLDPGHGIAQGAIWAAPDSCARGSPESIIEVSDGFASDVDTMRLLIRPIIKPLPPNPMNAPLSALRERVPRDTAAINVEWLIGEWEWDESPPPNLIPWLQDLVERPSQRGYRRRIIFRPNGDVEMLEIAQDRVLRVQRGTFSLAGIKLTFTNWLDSYYYKNKTEAQSFAVSKLGPDLFSLYPWDVTDAGVEIFARAPTIPPDGAADGSRIVTPMKSPLVKVDAHRTDVILPSSMKEALYRFEPEFRIRDVGGPSAIVGDFDGDLLPDIALLGRSGVDQVVISILSNHANIRVAEVAWQRLPPGPGEKKSRGDPTQATPVYLELAPRGTRNDFCWVDGPSYVLGTPVDAVGIVLPSGVRFDYVWRQSRFEVWGPTAYTALPGN